MADPIAAVDGIYDGLRALNAKACVPHLADDVVYVNAPWPAIRGTGELVDVLGPLFSSFKSWKVETLHEAVSPNGTVLNERVETFGAPGGGAKLEVFGVFDFDAAGKCTGWRDYWDGGTFATRMKDCGYEGAIPPSSPNAFLLPREQVQTEPVSKSDAFVREFMDAWCADGNRVAKYFAEDVEYINMMLPPNQGREASVNFVTGLMSATEGHEVIVHASAETASGVILNERTDTFKFDGGSINMAVTGVFEMAPDGTIRKWRDYFDWGVFSHRLGAVKPSLLAALS